MDNQIWLLLIISCPDVLSYSETVYFDSSCTHTEYELDIYKTIYLLWKGITVDGEECKLTFNPTSYNTKRLRVCVDAEIFNIHNSDCEISLRIFEDGTFVKNYGCQQSFPRWCGHYNKAVQVALQGANKTNISAVTEFRLKISSGEGVDTPTTETTKFSETPNTETVVFVAFLGGFIVLSTTLCLIRHFYYKHCGRRQGRENQATNNTNNSETPQDNSFIRGLSLPPPTYSYVMSHPADRVPSSNQDGQLNSTATEISPANVTFGLTPSRSTMESSSTGTLPPSYSSVQLSNIQIITPS